MWLRSVATIGFLSIVSLAQAWNQSSSSAPATAGRPDWSPSSRQGGLTVWRVVAVGPPRPVSVASLSPEVRSQTSGSFGQPAGSFGQTAGSYGQTSGSLGQSAGTTGRSAGSVGVSAGNFGVSTGALAATAAAANGSNAIAPKSDSALGRFIHDFDDGHSGTTINGQISDFEEMGSDELQARLDSVAGSPDAPDVLVGTPLPLAWSDQNSGLVRTYGLVPLGVVRPIPQTESGESAPARLEASILIHAPHPRSAREFIKWLSDRDAYDRDLYGRRPPLSTDAPSVAARNALGSVLFGRDVGTAADKQIAAFDPLTTQRAAMGVYGDGLLGGLRIEIDKSSVTANDRFAVVKVRAVMETRAAFGIAHAVVVLRVDERGQWRVLQLTPNLAAAQQVVATESLSGFGAKVRREEVAQVASASLAAPVDGDNRSPVPEFWWDNKGTGTLEVVEWQMRVGSTWNGSNLYFVPEDVGHLRTRTTGRFANAPGVYRWRVWSLGKGGTSAISGWRSVNILQQ